MGTITVRIHNKKDRVPGKVLKFSGNGLKLVTAKGAWVNVVRGLDGSLHQPVKLSKKQRRKQRHK